MLDKVLLDLLHFTDKIFNTSFHRLRDEQLSPRSRRKTPDDEHPQDAPWKQEWNEKQRRRPKSIEISSPTEVSATTTPTKESGGKPPNIRSNLTPTRYQNIAQQPVPPPQNEQLGQSTVSFFL